MTRTGGFGFVSNPEGEDVYVGKNVLPEGVEELATGQRLEYDFADGRPARRRCALKSSPMLPELAAIAAAAGELSADTAPVISMA